MRTKAFVLTAVVLILTAQGNLSEAGLIDGIALEDKGVFQPVAPVHVFTSSMHIKLVSGWGARDTVLISRKPFGAEDIARARRALAESKMTAVYLPDERIPNPFTELLHSPDPAAYQRAYRYDITPVSDTSIRM